MFEEIVAQNGTKFLIAAAAVLVGLLCLALVLWIMRGRPSSPFIRGGRNRTPRLAVLDAAAIDTRRRLVLIRRDEVEHLIMIGGPTDIVIESRIIDGAATTVSRDAIATPGEEIATSGEENASAKAAPTARVEGTPVVTRAATPVSAVAERRAANTPEAVSAMAKVLYAGDDETPARAIPGRPASQPTDTAQNRVPERRAEEALEQARQRVLQTPIQQTPIQTSSLQQPTAGSAALRPAGQAQATVTNPQASAADNPALVSEFEKLLEAEMSSAGTAGATPVNTQRIAAIPGQVAGTGTALPVAKSREETEAEMARLLGEISANRKAT
jgi:hypothetical protein